MTEPVRSCGSSCGCASKPAEVDEGRRGFLAGAVATGATVLAPGVTLFAYGTDPAAAAGADPKKRWGLLVDVSKCSEGCTACVTACSTEFGWKTTGHPATDPQWIRKVTLRDPKSGATRSAPVMCQHCAEPPCTDVCPTGASFKRADGIVLVDRHRCIGCRYCMMACPYKARSFIHTNAELKLTLAPRGKGCVESCNLCVHRRDHGQASTACADACAAAGHGAILFGDLRDPASPLSQALAKLPSRQLRENLALNTGVRYAGV